MKFLLLLGILGVVSHEIGTGGNAAAVGDVAINHTYDAGQAKKLVQAQFGPSVTVLSVKKVD